MGLLSCMMPSWSEIETAITVWLICLQPDKHWQCFEGNLGEIVDRQLLFQSMYGPFELYDAILIRNWKCYHCLVDLSSTRQTLTMFWGQPWGDCWQTIVVSEHVWAFWAAWCHLDQKLKLLSLSCWSVFNQTNIDNVLRATLGRLLTDNCCFRACMGLLSCMMPSWWETEAAITVLLICLQPVKHWHCFEGNLGETVDRRGRARMGLLSCMMPSWWETETAITVLLICLQSDKHWHCFEGNLGETVDRRGRARMGLLSCMMPLWSETETDTAVTVWLIFLQPDKDVLRATLGKLLIDKTEHVWAFWAKWCHVLRATLGRLLTDNCCIRARMGLLSCMMPSWSETETAVTVCVAGGCSMKNFSNLYSWTTMQYPSPKWISHTCSRYVLCFMPWLCMWV